RSLLFVGAAKHAIHAFEAPPRDVLMDLSGIGFRTDEVNHLTSACAKCLSDLEANFPALIRVEVARIEHDHRILVEPERTSRCLWVHQARERPWNRYIMKRTLLTPAEAMAKGS